MNERWDSDTGKLKYSPTVECASCPVTLGLNRYVDDDGRNLEALADVLARVALADGWYRREDSAWLCDACAPSAVERLGELADDRS